MDPLFVAQSVSCVVDHVNKHPDQYSPHPWWSWGIIQRAASGNNKIKTVIMNQVKSNHHVCSHFNAYTETLSSKPFELKCEVSLCIKGWICKVWCTCWPALKRVHMCHVWKWLLKCWHSDRQEVTNPGFLFQGCKSKGCDLIQWIITTHKKTSI